MKPRWIEVNDRMQQGYRYALVGQAGRDVNLAFRPDLTPAEMLALGVFGGKYMNDCRDEFPASWFAGARLLERKAASLNCFGVDASQPLSVWRAKGWIHPDDPRGCRTGNAPIFNACVVQFKANRRLILSGVFHVGTQSFGSAKNGRSAGGRVSRFPQFALR